MVQVSFNIQQIAVAMLPHFQTPHYQKLPKAACSAVQPRTYPDGSHGLPSMCAGEVSGRGFIYLVHAAGQHREVCDREAPWKAMIMPLPDAPH